MANRNFWAAMLAVALAFGMAVVGCDNEPADGRKISSELIGKWEFEKIIDEHGTQHNLPWGGINSGGYAFTSSGFTSYMNGSVAFSISMYTENNTLYAQNGQAGYSYSISGNRLTANAIDGSSGVIANKVAGFSWE